MYFPIHSYGSVLAVIVSVSMCYSEIITATVATVLFTDL